ncbi:hypothetical protein C4F40_08465 [Sphingobacterium sp. Ka21]|uniref:Permuted papain-like amidase YaeF/Yiix C92 family enzyme n=2 Tax=Sphingobacterium pedocola TaxID=2082722 RepID=A0ABR9T606_9SPHI|nr:hypothetical protein [Sphingobacterium pedocola]
MKNLCLLICIVLNTIACYGQKISMTTLKNGDLVFVGAQKENLSGAINRVTQREEDASFDHVGIIEVTSDSVFVLHASTQQGSVKEEINSFYTCRYSKESTIAIYRIKEEFQSCVPEAISHAKSMLGRPYNWTYILNDSSYYCSDFVERAFRKNSLFILEPMTFINPATQKTDVYWLEFYKKQNLAVPEGKLGCNPNGLATSSKLFFVGYLKE